MQKFLSNDRNVKKEQNFLLEMDGWILFIPSSFGDRGRGTEKHTKRTLLLWSVLWPRLLSQLRGHPWGWQAAGSRGTARSPSLRREQELLCASYVQFHLDPHNWGHSWAHQPSWWCLHEKVFKKGPTHHTGREAGKEWETVVPTPRSEKHVLHGGANTPKILQPTEDPHQSRGWVRRKE